MVQTSEEPMTAGTRVFLPNRWFAGLAVLLVLAVGLLLRIEDLRQPLVDQFSWRQASTAMMADNLPLNGWNPLWPEVSWTGDQRGYQGRELQSLSIAAAVLDHLFGWQDWHGRAVAILCGMVSIFALYRLVSVLSGRWQGVITAGLYAVLPGAVFIERSYLPEPAMLAFTLTGLCFVAEGLARRRAGLLLAGWLFVTLGLLAKVTAVAALPALVYLVVFGLKPVFAPRKLLLLALATVASGAIVFSYYRWAVHLGQSYPPYHIAGHGWLWDVGPRHFLANGYYLDIFRWHVETWLWGPVILALSVVGLLLPLPRSPDTTPATATPLRAPLFFQAWAFGAAILYGLAALELRDNSWNLHIFNPAAAGLAGHVLGWLVRFAARTGPPRIGAVLSVALLAGSMVVVAATTRAGLTHMRQAGNAQADYEIGARLADLACPGDLVAVSGTDVGSPIAIYYSRHRGFVFPPPDRAIEGDYGVLLPDGPEAIDVIRDFARRGARWFAFARASTDNLNQRFTQHHTGLIAFLDASAERVETNAVFTIYDLAKLSGQTPSPCPDQQ
jgi:hypothetical protein